MQFKVPFFKHDLGQEELDAIAEVFKGPILTTGETVYQFEKQFADYLGLPVALGVTSCTGALHMALLAFNIGPGDEVITTPSTFIATATSIIEAGAKPVFVDCEADTGIIDASLIEAAITPRTKALMPIHLYGQMADMKALRKIADKYKLVIIEDCAHSVESQRDGIKPGQIGDAACFSFFATKNLTCGEGGAIVTRHPHLLEPLKLLRLHGMNKTAADRAREGYKHWDMPVMGWKYNMDNIQAAMLLPQMKRLQKNLEKRQELAELYDSLLKNVPGITKPAVRENSVHARHLYPIWVDSAKRDSTIEKLIERGIGVVVNYRAIHLLTYFKNNFGFRPGQFPHAERIGDQTISLPFYPNMPKDQVEYVVRTLKELV